MGKNNKKKSNSSDSNDSSDSSDSSIKNRVDILIKNQNIDNIIQNKCACENMGRVSKIDSDLLKNNNKKKTIKKKTIIKEKSIKEKSTNEKTSIIGKKNIIIIMCIIVLIFLSLFTLNNPKIKNEILLLIKKLAILDKILSVKTFFLTFIKKTKNYLEKQK